MAMSKAEHLAWCKERALAELEDGGGGRAAAMASMIQDLGSWEGGEMYDAQTMQLMTADAFATRHTDADMRNWIEGFQ